MRNITEVCENLKVSFVDRSVRFRFVSRSVPPRRCEVNITIQHSVRNSEFRIEYGDVQWGESRVDFDLFSEKQFDLGEVIRQVTLSYESAIMPLFLVSFVFGGMDFLW